MVCWYFPICRFFGPGNGSPSATNVVLVVLILVIIRFFHSLRLCRFSTDRNETFHTLMTIFYIKLPLRIFDSGLVIINYESVNCLIAAAAAAVSSC